MREGSQILLDVIERWPDPLQAKFWRYVKNGQRSDAWRIIKTNMSPRFSREFSILMEDIDNDEFYDKSGRLLSGSGRR